MSTNEVRHDPDRFGPASRRTTRQVTIGNVVVGGHAPVVVQSMTNTDTADVVSTVKQVAELWRAGSELVRVDALHASEAGKLIDDPERDALVVGD